MSKFWNDAGFWGGLGLDEDEGPAHCPVKVDTEGLLLDEDGPEQGRWTCWCREPSCPLSEALAVSRAAAKTSDPGSPAHPNTMIGRTA